MSGLIPHMEFKEHYGGGDRPPTNLSLCCGIKVGILPSLLSATVKTKEWRKTTVGRRVINSNLWNNVSECSLELWPARIERNIYVIEINTAKDKKTLRRLPNALSFPANNGEFMFEYSDKIELMNLWCL